MSANTGRPEDRKAEQNAAAEKDDDFESGLDYGAFAEDSPDYPEDRLDQGAGEDAAEGAAAEDDERSSGSADPAGDRTAAAGPPTSEQPTRALSDVAAGASETGDGQDESRATAAIPAAGTAAASSGRPSGQGERATGDTGAAAQPTTEISASAASSGADREHVLPYPEGAAADAGGTGQDITDQDLDEEVAKDKRAASRVFQILIAIFFPLLVAVATIRLVASPVFLWIAYNRPGFPADDFGFSTADRLVYGSYGMDFLFNAADSRYLAELAPGGEELFTQAEVSHMADVKWVMVWAMVGGVVLLLLTLLFALLLRRFRPGGFARGIFAGSWVTLGLIGAIAVMAILNWQQFFESFHRVFFAEGTWTFSADSTLIRLYPGQFWIDAGIAAGALVILIAVVALIITWPTKRRRARRRQRLQEVYDARREKLVSELTKEAEHSGPRRR